MPGPAPAVPFEVACACGQPVRGVRQPRHQVLSCGSCGQPVFILPRSAYPVPEPFSEGQAPAKAGRLGFALVPRPWRLPLLAGLLTLAVVIGTCALLLPKVGRTDGERDAKAAAEVIRLHLRGAEKALAEGSFQLALREAEAARQERDRHPQALTASENRRLNQLHRESALLAGLLRNSLQEILHHASGLRRAEEWQAQFRDNYQGRSVVFDDVVRREADGRCSLAVYEVRAEDRPVRLELGGLKLLQALRLERPQRLVFGARLASVEREPPGVWVVRFQPDSGVLLTDAEALAACAPVPLDEELRQVLQRQAEWAMNLP